MGRDQRRRVGVLKILDGRYIMSFGMACDADHARMGGKCASLARMIAAGVNVPDGFAVTTEAYAAHLGSGELRHRIERITQSIDSDKIEEAEAKSTQIREAIMAAAMPAEVEAEIRRAYLAIASNNDLPVAVRSSATAEDMPEASFAGQQDT